MKLLFLTLLLSTVAYGQTEVSDKTIQQCFKHTSKLPADFERCASAEFERVRNLKRLKELRVLNGENPDSPCDKNDLKSLKLCFAQRMRERDAETQRVQELARSSTTYIPSYRHYPYSFYSPYAPYYDRYYYYHDFYPTYRYRYFRPFIPLRRRY
jgi:hypothetical protein